MPYYSHFGPNLGKWWFTNIPKIYRFWSPKWYFCQKKQKMEWIFFVVPTKKVSLQLASSCSNILILICQKLRGHPMFILAQSWEMVISHHNENIQIFWVPNYIFAKKIKVGVTFILSAEKRNWLKVEGCLFWDTYCNLQRS